MIVNLYKDIEKIWFRLDQKIRFILVGGFNTTVSFLIYYAFLYFTSGKEQLSLLLMNLVNIKKIILKLK